MSLCPCGSNLEFNVCCEKYILGKESAPTAEALMRSRYSAYVTEHIDYVGSTHAPSDKHEFDAKAATEWSRDSEWIGLEIKSVTDGGLDDDNGEVEFVASYKISGRLCSHHEIAQFSKIDDKWFYVDGKVLGLGTVKREAPKVGRNDLCICGSGKKYKKCCLNK